MGTTTQHQQRTIALLLSLFLLINTVSVDGKRLFGGGSSRKSSGSTGSRSHSSTGSRTHVSSPSHTSNHDAIKLSYGSSHSQPSRTNFGSTSSVNRGSSFGTNTHHQASAPHATVSPIGWNVPKNQGPPPAYSPSNPVGGAKTNLHESPPPYKPISGSSSAYAPSAPAYTGANTNTNNRLGTNNRPYTPAQTYRPRYNATGGGFGSGTNLHTPISATNAGHGVHSSYPRQQAPAGATYYPAGSSLPAGATYHPAGNVPHGATYYPSNSGGIPHGASYYPSGSHLPAGATYHPAGQVPPGAHFYPAGGAPAASYYPQAPAGATYLPSGAALPAGAVYYAQPPRSSSGLGFGSGLAAGALGGALLGHALTPSRTITQVQPGYGGGGYNSAPQGHDDKVIIINNGPPGSVSTTNAGDGVTVINAGGGQQQQPQPAQPAQPYQPSYQPAQPAQQPVQTIPAMQPIPPVQPAQEPGGTPLAQPSPIAGQPTDPSPQPPAEQTPPPAGGIICVPVRVPQPDPKDATKTIEVEQIACYPAPPPEATTANSTVAPTTEAVSTTNAASSTTTAIGTTLPTTQAPSVTTGDGTVLAPFSSTNAPLALPEGSVPLAPLNPTVGQPDIMRMPGEPTIAHHSASQAQLAPGSNLNVATSAANKYFDSFAFTSLLTLMLAYCLQ